MQSGYNPGMQGSRKLPLIVLVVLAILLAVAFVFSVVGLLSEWPKR